MGGWLHGEDAKDKDTPKLKGQLPANWGKLGLTDEQKQKVYKVQAEFKEKIADLEKQLKPQEIIDLFAFLALDKPPTDPTARPIPGTPPTLIK